MVCVDRRFRQLSKQGIPPRDPSRRIQGYCTGKVNNVEESDRALRIEWTKSCVGGVQVERIVVIVHVERHIYLACVILPTFFGKNPQETRRRPKLSKVEMSCHRAEGAHLWGPESGGVGKSYCSRRG